MSFLWVAGTASAGATILALGVDALSRRWRSSDPGLWHRVWRGYLAVVTVPLLWWLVARAEAGVVSITIWSIGALLLVRLLAGWWRVHRIARLAFPPASAHAARLAHAFGKPADGGPIFRGHQRLQTAVTVGWWRPVVLLPANWVWWPPTQLDVVVRHEMAHIARGDYLTSLWTAAAGAVFWFVPGVWLASRRLRWLAELSADLHAASVVGRETYVRGLLAAAGQPPGSTGPGFRLVFGPPGETPRLRHGAEDLHRRVAALQATP